MEPILEGIQKLMLIEEFEIFFKLVLIVILAGIVGYERESWKKPAGFRTYVLVGISAVLVMVCGDLLYEELGADPTRIPAQLLSGIGFLGAGTILRDGFNVKGLTTAAGLLAVTCIGLIVGAGFYIPAIVATFVVYCVLSYSHVLSSKLEHYYFIDLKIVSQKPKEILDDIRKVFNQEKLEIIQIKIVEDKEANDYIKLEVKYKEKVDVNRIVSKIMAINTVKEVVETKKAE
ncbi:MAG: MgtC/SapB family protein [Clostridia bacterium]|nr:MgtC/SapB family protein [Clostridia bacterium]